MALHVANSFRTSSARRETLHGRKWYVAEGTILKEGVLRGSQGSLFYPGDHVTKDPQAWNGMPIVLRHPQIDGTPVSARDPRVSDSYEIGRVYRTQVRNGNRLRPELWFDEARVKTVAPEIWHKLQAGLPIEVSTGLFLDSTPKRGKFGDREYTHVATNYRPDHLAILPDETGACSVADGCGVNVNTDGSGGANCGTGAGGFKPGNKCGKGKGGAEFATGEIVKFNGKAADGSIEGSMDVRIVNPHSNAHLVTKIERGRMYAGASSHLPTATVERPERKLLSGEIRPAKQFEAYHHTLRKLTGNADGSGGANPKRGEQGMTKRKTPATNSPSTQECPDCGGKMRKGKKCRCGYKEGAETPATNQSNTNHSQSGESEMKLTPEQRKEHVSFIVANCDCWKGEEATLNGLADDRLKKVRTEVEKTSREIAVANAARAGFGELINNSDPAALADQFKAVAALKAKADGDEAAAAAALAAKAEAVQNKAKAPTFDEWMAGAPSQVRSVVRNAQRVVDQQKQLLVERLVANVAEDKKAAKAKSLMAKELEELVELAELLPPTESGDGQPVDNSHLALTPFAPSFTPARPIGNASSGDEALKPFTLNSDPDEDPIRKRLRAVAG